MFTLGIVLSNLIDGYNARGLYYSIPANVYDVSVFSLFLWGIAVQ